MENDYRVMLLNFFKLYIYNKKKNESLKLSKVNRSTVKKKKTGNNPRVKFRSESQRYVKIYV